LEISPDMVTEKSGNSFLKLNETLEPYTLLPSKRKGVMRSALHVGYALDKVPF